MRAKAYNALDPNAARASLYLHTPPQLLCTCVRAVMVLMQLQWTKKLHKYFGFTAHFIGRALFFLFVGTNVLSFCNGAGCPSAADIFSWAVGGCCIFIGLIELLFGCRCASAEREDPTAGSNAFAEASQSRTSGAAAGGTQLASSSQSGLQVNPFHRSVSVEVSAEQAAAGARIAAAAAREENPFRAKGPQPPGGGAPPPPPTGSLRV